MNNNLDGANINLLIRKASIDDLRTIQDFNHALFLNEVEIGDGTNVDWPYEDGETYFRKMISGEIGVCFVAEIDKRIVGYLAGCLKLEIPSYRPLKRSELENMFVTEEHRSKGIGEKLVEKFLQWSKSLGAQRCFVSSYYANSRGITFYEKSGFKPYVITLETKLG